MSFLPASEVSQDPIINSSIECSQHLPFINDLSPSAFTQATLAVDAKIGEAIAAGAHDMDSIVISLKRQRNSYVPVSRIPDELTCQIFCYLLMVIYNETQRDFPVTDGLEDQRINDIIKITHVFHHWREIAVAYPVLWTHVLSNFRTSRTQCFLERSKSFSLQVLYEVRSPEERSTDLECLELTSKNLGRITDLCVLGEFRPRWDRLLWLLNQPAPHLRVLRLNLSFWAPQLWEDLFVFDARFLGGHAPLLEHLDILGAGINWTNPISKSITQNLRSLHIVGAYIETTSKRSSFHKFLQGCMQLEKLTFRCTGNSDLDIFFEEDTISIEPISLPYLKYFFLSHCSDFLTWFFEKVKIPNSTQWHLECAGGNFLLPDDVPIPRLEQSLTCSGSVYIEIASDVYLCIEDHDDAMYHNAGKGGKRGVGYISCKREKMVPLFNMFEIGSRTIEYNYFRTATELIVDFIPEPGYSSIDIPNYCWSRLFFALPFLRNVTVTVHVEDPEAMYDDIFSVKESIVDAIILKDNSLIENNFTVRSLFPSISGVRIEIFNKITMKLTSSFDCDSYTVKLGRGKVQTLTVWMASDDLCARQPVMVSYANA